jgi:UDP-GlcNAc3NAcA epimerase
MIKVLTIVGARPQIIKAAAVSRAFKKNHSGEVQEIIVHTGQHYDFNMSEVFFTELNIPKPDHNLNVGSGRHGLQTAAMINGIEEILINEKPQCIILYGDTNSTLAGAVAASKIHVPVVHIEAGLRSFNKKMPEEVNRIVCDHVSTLLFTPTTTGLENLKREGFKVDNKGPYNADNPKVYHCGDVMYDNSLYFSKIAESKTDILEKLKLKNKSFILGTIHRDTNTDDPVRLTSVFDAMVEIADKYNLDVIVPLHPRASKLLQSHLPVKLYHEISNGKKIKITLPVSFLEMIALEKNAKFIMTDSGGVQKEAYFFKKPVIILREETEWVEIVKNGTGILTGVEKERVLDAADHFLKNNKYSFPNLYGDGKAAEFICGEIVNLIRKNLLKHEELQN